MTAYGFWLPNDPRGSWSDFIAGWELLKFGKATTVRTRRSLAHEPHQYKRRMQAKNSLKHPPVSLTGKQAKYVAQGFDQYLKRHDLIVTACAILPEHTHLVVLRDYNITAERIANGLKSSATRRLKKEGIHPFESIASSVGKYPTMCARGCWKVFLNSEFAIHRANRYVENNPLREGKKRQYWSFVRSFR